MCGIWGAVNVGDREIAERAVAAICHRGPDGHGIYAGDGPVPVLLGNTRLAIIDLSDAGRQPMSTADGRYWIVYNGEVYNYQALRQELIEHKAELVRLLQPAPDLPPPVCDRCGGAVFWQSVAYSPWTCARCYPPDTWRIVARWSSPEAGRRFFEEGLQ